VRIEAGNKISETVAPEGLFQNRGQLGIAVGNVLLLSAVGSFFQRKDHLPQEEQRLVNFDRLLAQSPNGTENSF